MINFIREDLFLKMFLFWCTKINCEWIEAFNELVTVHWLYHPFNKSCLSSAPIPLGQIKSTLMPRISADIFHVWWAGYNLGGYEWQ